MSREESPPTTVAERSSPFTATDTSVAPSTTWALVRMWPASSITMPVPAPSPSTWNGPCCWTTWVEIETVDGSTEATTAATSIPPVDGVIPVSTAGVDGAAPVESSPARPATYPLAAPAATAASVNAAAVTNR